jgi:hypothetical protein
MTDHGLGKILYKGKELTIDVDDSTGVYYYEHIYRAGFNSDSVRQHMCLQWGSWCWKQANEEPFKALLFLLGRLAK